MTKRYIVNATSLHAIHEVQHSLQSLIDRFEEKYEKGEQLARKILIMAGSRGILNKRIHTTIDRNALGLLWGDIVSSESIYPFAANMLEIFTLEQTFMLIQKVLGELISPRNQNILK
jgi:hypothetical protein